MIAIAIANDGELQIMNEEYSKEERRLNNAFLFMDKNQSLSYIDLSIKWLKLLNDLALISSNSSKKAAKRNENLKLQMWDILESFRKIDFQDI